MYAMLVRQRIDLAIAIGGGIVATVGVVGDEWRAAAAGVVVMLAGSLVGSQRVHGRIDAQLSLAQQIPSVESVLADANRAQSELGTTFESGYRESLKAIDNVSRKVEEISERQARSIGEVGSLVRHQTSEIAAMFQLSRYMWPKEPMPRLGRWSVSFQELLTLLAIIDHHKPRLVVELGSGSSTVWLSRALSGIAGTRIVSIEHAPEHQYCVDRAISRHDLRSVTDVWLADLVPLDLDGETFLWYESARTAELSQIELLFVDGPPGGVRPMAKYPAIPILGQSLASDAIVVLRDVDEESREEVANRWCGECVGLERISSACGSLVMFRYNASQNAN